MLCGASAYAKHLRSLLLEEEKEEDVAGMYSLKGLELLGGE